MIKNTTIACLTILISLSVFGQPIINYSDINHNFSANSFLIQDSSIQPGEAGENVTWDFSTLNLPLVGTLRLVPVSQTPYHVSFPTSNFCYEVTNSSVAYQYFDLRPNSFEFLGQATASHVFVYNIDPVKIFELPYNYNSSFTDQYATTATSGSFTNDYDAYGTLVLPFGTFTNVVRQKSTFPLLQYVWYNTSPYYQIARLTIESGPFGQRTFTIWQDTTQLSVSQNEIQDSLTVYPNPNNGTFTLTSSNRLQQIIISDIIGKEIENISPNSMSTEISLNYCKTGTYLIKCISEQNVLVKKIIIK